MPKGLSIKETERCSLTEQANYRFISDTRVSQYGTAENTTAASPFQQQDTHHEHSRLQMGKQESKKD